MEKGREGGGALSTTTRPRPLVHRTAPVPCFPQRQPGHVKPSCNLAGIAFNAPITAASRAAFNFYSPSHSLPASSPASTGRSDWHADYCTLIRLHALLCLERRNSPSSNLTNVPPVNNAFALVGFPLLFSRISPCPLAQTGRWKTLFCSCQSTGCDACPSFSFLVFVFTFKDSTWREQTEISPLYPRACSRRHRARGPQRGGLQTLQNKQKQ